MRKVFPFSHSEQATVKERPSNGKVERTIGRGRPVVMRNDHVLPACFSFRDLKLGSNDVKFLHMLSSNYCGYHEPPSPCWTY